MCVSHQPQTLLFSSPHKNACVFNLSDCWLGNDDNDGEKSNAETFSSSRYFVISKDFSFAFYEEATHKQRASKKIPFNHNFSFNIFFLSCSQSDETL